MRRGDLEMLVVSAHTKVKNFRRITYLTSMVCSAPHTHIPEPFLFSQIVYILLNLTHGFEQKIFALGKVKFGQYRS